MDGLGAPNERSTELTWETHGATEAQFHGSGLRSIMVNKRIWFVAKDICDALELADPTTMLRKLHVSERGTAQIQTTRGPRSMAVVNESGLYLLIFNSTKPEAVEFRMWVTDEVLPSLRRGAAGERQDTALGRAYVCMPHPGMYLTCLHPDGMISTDPIDAATPYVEGFDSAEVDALAIATMLVATLWRRHSLLNSLAAFNEHSNSRHQMNEAIRQANHIAQTLMRNRRDRATDVSRPQD